MTLKKKIGADFKNGDLFLSLNMKFRMAILSLSFLLLAETCNQEVVMPRPELKKIFGRWEWIETSGGFMGKIITPAKAGYAEEIEFRKDGTFLKFKGNNLVDKKIFSFATGKSIYQKDTAYQLVLSTPDSSLRESSVRQLVSFSGGDTLFLKEECHDCFAHVYVRKK